MKIKEKNVTNYIFLNKYFINSSLPKQIQDQIVINAVINLLNYLLHFIQKLPTLLPIYTKLSWNFSCCDRRTYCFCIGHLSQALRRYPIHTFCINSFSETKV